jgi:glycosyl transferase family 25
MSKTPIFIINLGVDVEKRAHMEALCEVNKIEAIFIDAVYGKKLSNAAIQRVYNKELSIIECGRELTLGELGCTLSHLKIYKQMLAENIEQAVVLEDDVLLTPEFLELVSNVSNFPDDYELMLLGYYADEVTEKRTRSNLWSHHNIVSKLNALRLVQPTYGTHGYIINNAGAQKLVNELRVIKKPIDHYTGREDYLNMYALEQRVVLLDPSYKAMSIIEAERRELVQSNQDVQTKDKKNPLLKSILRSLHLFDCGRFIYTTYKQVKFLRAYKENEHI